MDKVEVGDKARILYFDSGWEEGVIQDSENGLMLLRDNEEDQDNTCLVEHAFDIVKL